MKAINNHLNKIILMALCLFIIGYSQGGYAVMERSLYKDKNTGIEYVKLKVSDTVITPEIAIEIANVLTNSSPPVGDLEFEHVTFELGTVSIITQALQANPTLRSFIMQRNIYGGNCYRDENDKKAIVETLGVLPMLTELEVTDFGDNYIPMFINILTRNRNLNRLNLNANNISDQETRLLAQALRTNKSLIILELACNNIGDEGLMAIAEALEENRTLKCFTMTYNSRVSENGVLAFIKRLAKNTNMVMEHLTIDRQEDVVYHIFRRNKFIRCLREKIKKVMQNIDMAVLSGSHPKLGADSPLGMASPDILRKIVTNYRENELEFILGATESQLSEFTQGELEAVSRIKLLQKKIVEQIQLLEEVRNRHMVMPTENATQVIPEGAAATIPIINAQQSDERQLPLDVKPSLNLNS